MEEKVLFKQRSITGCMKASYDLISSNIKQLLGKTWQTVLPFSILLGITIYFTMPNKALHDWGAANPWTSFIVQTIIYLGTLLMSFIAGASVWSWLNKKSLRKNIVPFSVLSLILAVLNYIPVFFLKHAEGSLMALASKGDVKGTLMIYGAMLLFLLVIVVLSLPFCYLIPRRMLLKEDEKMLYGKSFLKGLRHGGGFFMTCFLGGIILTIIVCIVCLPAGIIGAAQMQSQLGALEGDPLGTPAYFTPLLIAFLIISCFITIYAMYWLEISLAYQYGSIKTQDDEKEKIKNNNHTY